MCIIGFTSTPVAQRQHYALKAKELGYEIKGETEREGVQPQPFGLQIIRDQGVTPAQIVRAMIEGPQPRWHWLRRKA
jgi:hypothetical protein